MVNMHLKNSDLQFTKKLFFVLSRIFDQNLLQNLFLTYISSHDAFFMIHVMLKLLQTKMLSSEILGYIFQPIFNKERLSLL